LLQILVKKTCVLLGRKKHKKITSYNISIAG
jgi:hypothetical protein